MVTGPNYCPNISLITKPIVRTVATPPSHNTTKPNQTRQCCFEFQHHFNDNLRRRGLCREKPNMRKRYRLELTARG